MRPLAEILDDVERFTSRFVMFRSHHQGTAIALWVAHCYAIEAAHAAAYLRITSAVEESGKTTLVEVLEQLLGDRGINAVSISPAAVFRTRDKVGPVALLLDEIDNTLRNRQDDGARDLLALVNAGYRRSATVIRTVGREHEARRFRAFGPAAIAGLGQLHPTTESRCIPIVLDRKMRGQGERWLPFLLEAEAQAIREQLAAWATEQMVNRLRNAEPAVPTEMRDRHVEVWWGMFAIADEARHGWDGRARSAALALHDDSRATASNAVTLLDHIRAAFDDAGTDRLPTAELLRALVKNEEGPWGRWWGAEVERGDAPRAAAADLARHLKPFEIKPRVIRLDGVTARGYLVGDFEGAFDRYLAPSRGDVTDETHVTPLASPVTSVTSVTGGHQGGSDGCPDCGWKWFHGHAEDCSRRMA